MTALQISGRDLLIADLIIIAYDTEATAEAARKKLLELQKEYLIELGDAVVAVRQPDGHVKLNQLVSTTAAGAASGGGLNRAHRMRLSAARELPNCSTTAAPSGVSLHSLACTYSR